MEIETDSAQVQFPPPLALLAFNLLGVFLHYGVYPLPFLGEGLHWLRWILGGAVFISCVVVVVFLKKGFDRIEHQALEGDSQNHHHRGVRVFSKSHLRLLCGFRVCSRSGFQHALDSAINAGICLFDPHTCHCERRSLFRKKVRRGIFEL